jgi:hypothetical protein
MKHPYQKVLTVVMLGLLATGLVACKSKDKKDPNMVLTEAVQTVSVQLTADAAKLPPATQTPLPTIAIPTATVAVATLPPVVVPTTAPTAVSAGGNSAQYVSQTPADDTVFLPGQTFTMTWKLKNIGTTTWTSDYLLRFFASDQAGVKLHTGDDNQRLNKTVKPGETVDISIAMKAPSSKVTVKNAWVLTNVEGVNFMAFDIRIKVGEGSATSTVTPTTGDEEETVTETPDVAATQTAEAAGS